MERLDSAADLARKQTKAAQTSALAIILTLQATRAAEGDVHSGKAGYIWI